MRRCSEIVGFAVDLCSTLVLGIMVSCGGGGGGGGGTSTPPPPAPPTVTLLANPVSIYPGQSSTLNWTTTSATTLALTDVQGPLPLNGTASVSPSVTTTYTATASGPGGTATATATVGVLPPTALQDAIVVTGSAPDWAVVDQLTSFTLTIASVAPDVKVASYSILPLGLGAEPTIDSAGFVRWTPGTAAAGNRILTLRVKSNRGDSIDFQYPFEVCVYTKAMEFTPTAEGGMIFDELGEFSVSVPPNSLDPSQGSPHIEVGYAQRMDGGRVILSSSSGLKSDAEISVIPGPTPISDLSRPSMTRQLRPVRSPTATGLAPIWGPNSDPLEDPSGHWQGKSPIPINTGRYLYKIRFNSETAPKEYNFGHYVTQPALAVGSTYGPETAIANLYGEFQSKEEFVAAQNSTYNTRIWQPVLFIHGYYPDNWLINGWGGGKSTWQKAFQMVKSIGDENGVNIVVYEYVWKTDCRFEEQAFFLDKAIDYIRSIIPRNPILIAHSFGGVLSATYISGFAEYLNQGSVISWPFRNDVFHLITIGSPLSGIAPATEISKIHIFNRIDLPSYTLIQGADPNNLIKWGSQLSTWETGGNDIAAEMFGGTTTSDNLSALRQSDFKRATGFYVEPLGSVIGKLSAGWSRIGGTSPVPSTIMLGVSYKPNELKYFRDGDGLISKWGQLLRQQDSSILNSIPGTGGLQSSVYNHKYFIMNSINYYGENSNDELNAAGFFHNNYVASIAYQEPDSYFDSKKYANNALEVSIGPLTTLEGVKFGYLYKRKALTINNIYKHPLRTVLENVINKAKSDNIGENPITSLKTQIFGNVTIQGEESKRVPILVQVLQKSDNLIVFRDSRIQSETDGSYNVDFRFPASPQQSYRVQVVLGNSAEVFTNTSTNDWAESLNLGKITLTPRMVVKTNFYCRVITTTGSPVASARVRILPGANVPLLEFDRPSPFPSSLTSRDLTTDGDGKTLALGMLAGQVYTALVQSQGREMTCTFSLPADGWFQFVLTTSPWVSISENNVTVQVLKTAKFTAAYSQPPSANVVVSWKVIAGGGSITQSGTYTAPSTPGSARVRASIFVNGTEYFDEAVITVQPQLQPPSNLVYSMNPAVYTAGSEIPPNAPSYSGGAPTAYTVSPTLPAGLSLNAGSGLIIGTPTLAMTQATYVVTGSNSAGSTTCNLVITVSGQNRAPSTPLIVGPSSLTVGQTGTYQLTSTDPDGDPITFQLSPATAGATINGSVLTFVPAASGSTTLSVVARDSKGAASSAGTKVVTVTGGSGTVLINETFSGAGIPSGWTPFPSPGIVTVTSGQLRLVDGCIVLPGTFNRSSDLTIEADVTIFDGAIGDFNLYAFYDGMTDQDVGPRPNGYNIGYYPNGSDNLVDLVQLIQNSVISNLSTTPSRIAAGVQTHLAAKFKANGQIEISIGGVQTMSLTNSTRQSGKLAFRSWGEVRIDNVKVTSG